MYQGKVLGSFAMYYRDVRSPSPAETRLLDIAVHIAGIAIERQRAAAAVQESERRHRLLVETIDEIVYLVAVQDDPLAGRLQFVSPQVEHLLGYSPDDFLRDPGLWFRSLHPDDRPQVMARTQQLATRKDKVTREYRFRRKGAADYRWLEDRVVPQYDEHGQLVAMFGVARDITERKRLEEQYRHAQKMEAIGQLAGGVAHDFNNLLTVILGYCDVLLDELRFEAPARSAVNEVRRASERAAALTRQLLAFSRRQWLTPQVLDLNRLVTEMETMLRRLIGEHITFQTVLAPALGRVKADPGQLEQVLMNLLVNARDAMPQGGTVLLATADVDVQADFVREHPEVRPGPYVRLTVSDSGSGMSQEVQAHLFEPFFTTKERGKGTGLGLAMVYGIIKQSDGYIDVDSEPGRGTTFHIFLPRVQEPLAREGLPPSPSSPRQGVETVLLVEDEAAVRDLACQALEARGYTVLAAANATEALQRSAAHAGPIHLLLTDVVMPGMGGPELAEKLRALRPEIKVLYCTGYSDNPLMTHHDAAAGPALLPKPFTRRLLARKVREVLDQK